MKFFNYYKVNCQYGSEKFKYKITLEISNSEKFNNDIATILNLKEFNMLFVVDAITAFSIADSSPLFPYHTVLLRAIKILEAIFNFSLSCFFRLYIIK